MRKLAAGLAAALAAATPAILPSSADAAVLQCGDTVTTNVTLTADILGCTETALHLATGGVTINLNGHRITHGGPDDLTDVGIDVHEFDDVKIRNGTIAGFERGVHLSGNRGSVAALRSLGNRQGVQIEGNGNRVSDSRFTDASNAVFAFQSQDTLVNGISTASDGGQLRFFQGARNRVLNNDASRGIFMFDQSEPVVTGNRGAGPLAGINVVQSHTVFISGNRITGGGFPGIRVADSEAVRVVANRAIGIDGAAFTLQFIDRAQFANNLAQRSDAGLSLLSSEGVFVDDNVLGASSATSGATGGNGVGLAVCCSINGGSVLNIRRNRVHGNEDDGIDVPEASTRVLLEDNVANFNGGDGLDVATTDAMFTRNRAARNDGWGILAPPGVTDGGGNVAFGNGLRDCSPSVSC